MIFILYVAFLYYLFFVVSELSAEQYAEQYTEQYAEQYTEQYAEQYQRIFLYIVPLSKYCSFRGQKYIPKYQFDTLGL